jgi:hypothetical protein
MSMTFSDDVSERRGRGRARLQEHKARALCYGECLYEAIRVGENFLFLLKNRGTCFIL